MLIVQNIAVGAASVVSRENWSATPATASRPPAIRPTRRPKCRSPIHVTAATVTVPARAPKILASA